MNSIVSRFGQGFLFSALFSLCLVPIGVLAQEESGASMIEEIVVTARKIEENLRDVPATVNALTADAIEERGIASIQDIADATPGFDFAQAFGRNDFRPVIRGQSNILGRPNAGLFVDGIIIEEGNASVPLAALERVEVVKGPQSALYGRSTLAGAVNYVLRGPGESFSAEASAEIGERDYSRISVHAGGPFSDTFGVAVTISQYQRGGEYNNSFAGNALGAPAVDNEVGDEESTSFTGVATFTPNDRLSIRLHGIYEATDDAQYAIGILPYSMNNCFQTPRGTPHPQPPAGTPEATAIAVSGRNAGNSLHTTPYGGTGYYCGEVDVSTVLENSGGGDNASLETDYFPFSGIERDSLRLGLRWDYDINDNLTLTSVTGYNSVDTEDAQDQTFGQSEFITYFGQPARLGFLTWDEDEFEDFSQELRLSGGFGTSLRYVVGAYYYDSEESSMQVTSSDGRCGFTFFGANPANCKASWDPQTQMFGDNGAEAITNMSVFGSVQFDLSEQLTVNAELRYNEDEISKRPEEGDTWLEETFDAVLPKLTLSYRYDDNTLIYGNVALGNKPGNINDQAGLPEAERPVDEENAVSYEAGIKSLLMDGRAEANIAVFHTEWEDMQLTTTRNVSVMGQNRTFSITQNIGEARITGLEVDFNVRLTDFWDARLAYAWIDSEIEEFTLSLEENATTVPGTFREAALIFGYAPSGDVILAGQQLPHTSEHQASLSTSFHGQMMNGWGWFARADWNYNSKRYPQVYNLAHTGDRQILNLRAGVANDRLAFDVWVDNALDDDASPALIRYVQGSGTAFYARAIGATLPEQRRAGITARVSL
ncbi:MAG: TonB-dependent receptor [Gammaproteobacteria bacterium]|nr:TonB-dependent receptor [Gammaproteobacteria bacterium]